MTSDGLERIANEHARQARKGAPNEKAADAAEQAARDVWWIFVENTNALLEKVKRDLERGRTHD